MFHLSYQSNEKDWQYSSKSMCSCHHFLLLFLLYHARWKLQHWPLERQFLHHSPFDVLCSYIFFSFLFPHLSIFERVREREREHQIELFFLLSSSFHLTMSRQCFTLSTLTLHPHLIWCPAVVFHYFSPYFALFLFFLSSPLLSCAFVRSTFFLFVFSFTLSLSFFLLLLWVNSFILFLCLFFFFFFLFLCQSYFNCKFAVSLAHCNKSCMVEM